MPQSSWRPRQPTRKWIHSALFVFVALWYASSGQLQGEKPGIATTDDAGRNYWIDERGRLHYSIDRFHWKPAIVRTGEPLHALAEADALLERFACQEAAEILRAVYLTPLAVSPVQAVQSRAQKLARKRIDQQKEVSACFRNALQKADPVYVFDDADGRFHVFFLRGPSGHLVLPGLWKPYRRTTANHRETEVILRHRNQLVYLRVEQSPHYHENLPANHSPQRKKGMTEQIKRVYGFRFEPLGIELADRVCPTKTHCTVRRVSFTKRAPGHASVFYEFYAYASSGSVEIVFPVQNEENEQNVKNQFLFVLQNADLYKNY